MQWHENAPKRRLVLPRLLPQALFRLCSYIYLRDDMP